MNLRRTTFDEVVHNLSNYRDSSGDPLDIVSLVVSDPDVYFEKFFKPYGDEIVDVRSVSKAFVCATVGIAIDRGLRVGQHTLALNLPVWPVLRTLVTLENQSNRDRIERVTLEHLLTHTMGQEYGIMFSSDIRDIAETDLLSYAINTDLTHDPGTHHAYSNVGPYLISVLLQIGTGRSLFDLCRELLLDPLGIDDVSWRCYGEFTAGCTGLKIKNSHLHRLGRCFADDGQFDGAQVVPASWIQEMQRVRCRTPDKYNATRTFPKYGYGLLAVVTDTGIFYQDGSDSQYLIVLPDRRLVISTTARQSHNVPVTEAMRPLINQT